MLRLELPVKNKPVKKEKEKPASKSPVPVSPPPEQEKTIPPSPPVWGKLSPVSIEEEDTATISTGSLSLSSKLSPMSIEEEDTLLKSAPGLNLKPILKKKDIESPLELLDPDLIEEESQFVSQALEPGKVVYERYEIIKILAEKRNYNIYCVKDKSTNKKIALHEFIPDKEMGKSQLKERRLKFQDSVRVLATFKHKNLAEVLGSFSENNREYYACEYVCGVTLVRLMNMNKTAFKEEDVRKWGDILCDAITFLHDRPVPFTLGDFHPSNIMVSEEGDLKIVNYDLQRFFDSNRSIEFFPDDSKKMFNDITKLARVLYYLLTKEEYDETAYQIRFPDTISPKMKNLLDITCMKGQQSVGYMGDFRKKLEDTSRVEEVESIEYKSRVLKTFNEVRRMLDAFNIQKIGSALYGYLLNQKPYMMGIELIFILAVIIFHFNPPFTPASFYLPPEKPAIYVTAGDFIFTIDPQTLTVADQRELGFRGGEMLPLKTKIKNKETKKMEDLQVLMICHQGGSGVAILDKRNNSLLQKITTDINPFRLMPNPVTGEVWVLHRSVPAVITLNPQTLQKLQMFKLMEGDPANILYIPGSPSDDKDEESSPLYGLLISTRESKNLISLDPQTLRERGKVKLDFVPGAMVSALDQSRIYILDPAHDRIQPVNFSNGEIDAPVVLPQSLGEPSDLIYEPQTGIVWVSFHNSHSIISWNPSMDKFGESVSLYPNGLEPVRMFLRPGKNQIWIVNRKSKNIVVKNSSTGETITTIPLGMNPSQICFWE